MSKRHHPPIILCDSDEEFLRYVQGHDGREGPVYFSTKKTPMDVNTKRTTILQLSPKEEWLAVLVLLAIAAGLLWMMWPRLQGFFS